MPFGVPDEPPRPGEGPRERFGLDADDEIVLWNGGLWDWLDAESVLRAVARLSPERPRLRLVFMGASRRRPGPRRRGARQALARDLGLLGRVVRFNDDWVPYAQRGAWLLQADCAVTAHHDHLETRFALRTRLLDCLWAGLPVVCTRGDELAERVEREDLGATVAARGPRRAGRGARARARPRARAPTRSGWRAAAAASCAGRAWRSRWRGWPRRARGASRSALRRAGGRGRRRRRRELRSRRDAALPVGARIARSNGGAAGAADAALDASRSPRNRTRLRHHRVRTSAPPIRARGPASAAAPPPAPRSVAGTARAAADHPRSTARDDPRRTACASTHTWYATISGDHATDRAAGNDLSTSASVLRAISSVSRSPMRRLVAPPRWYATAAGTQRQGQPAELGAQAPVGVLEVGEEALVEPADLLERPPAVERGPGARARDDAGRVVLPAVGLAVAAPPGRAVPRDHVAGTVEHARLAQHPQLARGRARARVGVERGDELGEPAGVELHVVVEQRDELARRGAAIPALTAPRSRGSPPEPTTSASGARAACAGGAVRRAVVDDDHLEVAEALLAQRASAAVEQLARRSRSG